MFYKIMISKKEGEFKEEEVKELFKDFSLIEEAPNEQADNKVKTVYIKLNDKNKKNCLDSIINEENTKSVYSIKKNMVLKLPEEIQQITNVTSQQNNVIKLANNGAVGYSVPIRRDEKGNNRLFVGSVSSETNNTLLTILFSQFGEVKEIDRKSNLQTNGCCFITMDSNESCVKAIIGLNKKIPLGCKSTITVELAKNMSRNTGNNRQALPCYQTFLNNKANTATRNINSKFQSAPGKPLTDDSDDDLFILSSSNEQKSYFNSDNVPKVVKTKPSHRL